MDALKILVILGSTRPNRFGDKPAKWIFEEAKKLANTEVEMVDLRESPLPFFDQAMSPSMNTDGNYGNDAVNAWSKKIAAADAFIIGVSLAFMCKRWYTRAIWIAWPAWVWFCVMATANHFWLDVIGGVIVAVAAFVILRYGRRLAPGGLGLREPA